MSSIIVRLITLYEGLIILRAIVSWFATPHTQNRLVEMLEQLTDPVLKPVRELLPPTDGIDFSPLVVLIGLELVKRILL